MKDNDVLCCGLDILARRLEAASKADAELGHENHAAEKRRDVVLINESLKPKIQDNGFGSCLPKHRVTLHRGLSLYLHNLRACSGTLKGVGKTTEADACKTEADELESRLLKELEDQVSLPLLAGAAAAE